jgi:hypothetical protein
MDYVLEPFTGGPITLPVDAVRGILADVIGDPGLLALFKFSVIGGGSASAGVVAGLPAIAPTPLASPRASALPSPTVRTAKPTSAPRSSRK